MRGLVRILIMFGPMIFRQIQKFQRNKTRQVAAPQQRQPERTVRQQPQNKKQQPQNKNQQPVEEAYYDEDIPQEGEFVDPINN